MGQLELRHEKVTAAAAWVRSRFESKTVLRPGKAMMVSHPPRLGAMYGILTASTKREVASRSPSTCTIDWWLCKRGGNVTFDLRDDKPAAARGTLRTFY